MASVVGESNGMHDGATQRAERESVSDGLRLPPDYEGIVAQGYRDIVPLDADGREIAPERDPRSPLYRPDHR